MLVITGIGKLRAAIATTHLMHLASNHDEAFLINVGSCGATTDQLALGETVCVHKIWDHATGKEYFPDMLLKIPLKGASLGTFDQPVAAVSGPNMACDVVDMEASGIFQAAYFFLAPHQMMFLKIVTDYLQFSSDNFSEMLRFYHNSVPDWMPLITGGSAWNGSGSALTEGQELLVVEVAARMRLTQTQTHQLKKAAQRFMVRGGENLDLLRPHLQTRPKHKCQRNQLFESMIKALNSA